MDSVYDHNLNKMWPDEFPEREHLVSRQTLYFTSFKLHVVSEGYCAQLQ